MVVALSGRKAGGRGQAPCPHWHVHQALTGRNGGIKEAIQGCDFKQNGYIDHQSIDAKGLQTISKRFLDRVVAQAGTKRLAMRL
jgi:hypothetical protein